MQKLRDLTRMHITCFQHVCAKEKAPTIVVPAAHTAASAAAAPEQALMLVLAAVPEGWTVALSEVPAQEMLAGVKLEPGEAMWIG